MTYDPVDERDTPTWLARLLGMCGKAGRYWKQKNQEETGQ